MVYMKLMFVVSALLLSGCGVLKKDPAIYNDLSNADMDKYAGLYQVTHTDGYAPVGTYIIVHNEIVRKSTGGGSLHFLTVENGKLLAKPNPVFKPTSTFDGDDMTISMTSSPKGKARRVSVDSLPEGELKKAARFASLAARLQTALRRDDIEVQILSVGGIYELELDDQMLALVQTLVDNSNEFREYMNRNRIGHIHIYASGTAVKDALGVTAGYQNEGELQIYPKQQQGTYPTPATLLERMRSNSIPRI